MRTAIRTGRLRVENLTISCHFIMSEDLADLFVLIIYKLWDATKATYFKTDSSLPFNKSALQKQ